MQGQSDILNLILKEKNIIFTQFLMRYQTNNLSQQGLGLRGGFECLGRLIHMVLSLFQ